MKILTIIGARPQFIKAAAVSRVIRSQKVLEEILVHTGQHFDTNMSEIFFEELDIPVPKYNLGICGGNHGAQTGKMLAKIEEVFLKEKPEFVMVYGDTNSTLAGALAAVKLHIPIAHVEAGLRSFNKQMPEEINRILTDHASDLLFTPTLTAVRNLELEGISKKKIVPVGDVMLDATNYYTEKAEAKSTILNELKLSSKNYVLVTIHRAENTDNSDKLKGIFEGFEKLAETNTLIVPLHPRTRNALLKIGFSMTSTNIRFIDPLGYLDMLILEKHSKIIITDSGGIQKEAYFHNVPCITLRDETEWTELVDLGCNFLANPSNLIGAFNKVEEIDAWPEKQLYGKGDAALKIVSKLSEY